MLYVLASSLVPYPIICLKNIVGKVWSGLKVEKTYHTMKSSA